MFFMGFSGSQAHGDSGQALRLRVRPPAKQAGRKITGERSAQDDAGEAVGISPTLTEIMQIRATA